MDNSKAAELSAVGSSCAKKSEEKNAHYRTFLDIFLSERYRKLAYVSQSEEALAAAASPVSPLKVQRFLTEGCLVKSVVMGAGGGVLGLLFGTFMFALKPMDADTSLPFMQQVKQQYKGFIPDVTRSAKNFAKIGLIYSLVECFLERERACRDVNSAVYAGCVTGAALAWKGGALAMAGGCTMFAAFSGMIEKFQPFSGGE